MAPDNATYNRAMSATAKKHPRPKSVAGPVARSGARPGMEKPVRVSQLRAQTRKLLGKHYRAKYGVR